MTNGYSRTPRLLKGALIELTEPFLGPVPNIIVFQYNPEKMQRSVTLQGAAKSAEEGQQKDKRRQVADPGEALSLTLELDATDALEFPAKHPVAVVSGVADRIAAIEMLLYSESDDPIEKFLSTLGGLDIKRKDVPLVLFVWGPGRIIPVRISNFSVEEQAYSPTLYPIRATVSLSLSVLTPESFGTKNEKGETVLDLREKLALKAYQFTKLQKQTLARANVANSVESIVTMLPL